MRAPCLGAPGVGRCPYGALATSRGRCAACNRAREQARGTPAQRGYDAGDREARRLLRETVPGVCGYGCGRWLYPNGSWVAAHVVDGQPQHGWIAACYACNEQAKRVGERRGEG